MVEAAFNVNLLLPLPGAAMPVGARLAVTPFGSPLSESATADLNPVSAAVDTVIGMLPPAVTFAFEAPSVRVKLGTTTVSVNG